CVLKGPWLSLLDDDADIFPLAHGRRAGETLHARLMASADQKYDEAKVLVRELTARGGEDAFGFLSWALEHADRAGRSAWLRVFSRLGQEARDPLEELLERALSPGRHAAPTLQRFLADIEADSVEVKREMELGLDAIRVMTVHGAKGLEAPVVILPDTTGEIKKKADNGLLETVDGFAYSPSGKQDDDVTALARAAHEVRAEAEHWRLLYVAMTRARDRLIVCGYELGNTKTGAAAGAWHTRIWDSLSPVADKIETAFGDGLRLGAPMRADALALPALSREAMPQWALTPLTSRRVLRAAAPSRLKAPALLSPRSAGQKRFQRGRLIHGLLERLPDLPRDAREGAAHAWLKRMGVEDAAAKMLWDEARAVLDESAFAAVFGPGSRAEVPLCGEAGGRQVRGIVDRLIVSSTEIQVLDFKSDRPAPLAPEDAPAAYVLQMALYRAVLTQIFPKLPVRCALLWTERPALTELKAEQLNAALEEFGRS
ncbi:MAG: 3'-5' exonuclease, partial [Caulobacterales bacterium]